MTSGWSISTVEEESGGGGRAGDEASHDMGELKKIKALHVAAACLCHDP